MTVTHLEPPDQDDEDLQQGPSAVPSERALLGAALWAGQTSTEQAHALIDDLAATVEPGDMWLPAHARIWQALIMAAAEAAPCDAAAIASRVASDGGPAAAQVVQLLPGLLEHTTVAASASWHATRISEAATARRTAQVGRQITQRALTAGFDPAVDGSAALEALERAVGLSKPTGGGPVGVAEVVERAVDLIEHPDHIDVIPSGLDDLDMLVPGARPGQLIVIGARPSIGKSTVGLTWAAEAAIRLKYPTVLFSLEMPRVDVVQRLIAARARVDLAKILAGTADERDWDAISKYLPDIQAAPLVIDDSSDLSVGEIRARLRRSARRGARLAVIDYLQLIRMGGRAESRQAGVDELTRQLKVLAGDLEIPIILLCQLNRGPEQRVDKRPAMSDLRESGGIENHADVVILLHRPDFYDPEKRPGECDLIVAKHRNGRTGTATAAFQGHYARLVSMATSFKWS